VVEIATASQMTKGERLYIRTKNPYVRATAGILLLTMIFYFMITHQYHLVALMIWIIFFPYAWIAWKHRQAHY
jgi:hypothetical protein